MKVNCWDKCFLCLTNFTSSSSSCGGKRSRARQKQVEINGKPNLSVLIKYLLGNWDQSENESLLQRIRRLQLPNSSTSSAEGRIKFCDKCHDSARRISQLQTELEVIQMKIVDILCSVKKTVIGNSNGNRGTSGLTLEEYTEESQEILDTLQAFQAAVVEQSKESVHVPLVYLEKFTGCKNVRTNWATAAQVDELNLIKTEPEADTFEEILNDFGNDEYDDDDDYAASPIDEFNDGEVDDDHRGEEKMDTINDVDVTPTPTGQTPLAPPTPPLPEVDLLPRRPPRKLQKRGRPRKNPPVQDIKEEQAEFSSFSNVQDLDLNPVIKEEQFVDGTRKSRSAAQTAAKRIADAKNLSRASFKYRPRQVAKRAKKMKQVKTMNREQVKTKRKSSRASSSSHQPPSPILPRKRNDKFFQCELCPYNTRADISFRVEHHLREHESSEVVNHTCPHCTTPTRQFSHKQSFDYHMNSHAGFNKMACDICTKFIDPFAILEHLQGHPNVEKIFECSGCSYLCGTREGYLKHIRHHAAAALICDVCSQKFRTRQRLLDHLHDEHNLLEKIKCDVENCDKEFFETFMLTAHKKRHAETETFPCLDCNLQFPTAKSLLGHQVQEHSKEKPHPCSECPEAFMDKSTLESHLIKSHGAAKFKCPHCPKEFASRKILSLHINFHDEISFPCDKCDKVFGNRAKLTSHQYVHRTTKDFVCEDCGKAFRCAKLLRTHLKIHIGDKRHKCSYCPKGFVDRKNLISHERIHTGEKPYVCETCGKDFNQRSALNVHRRTQHKQLIANKNQSEVTTTLSTLTLEEVNVG